MGLLSRIFSPAAAKHVEGEYRPGPWLTSSGWIGASWPLNWWQSGYDPSPAYDQLAIVEACVSAYAQTIAMCPGSHWRGNDDGGRELVRNSALSRILRRPNSYQTISDFKLGLVRSLYTKGNAYAVGLRNARNEIEELHLMSPDASSPRVAQNGELFYSLGGNEIIERQLGVTPTFNPLAFVPARDVLHIRLHTPQHPLKGESPLAAVALDLAQARMMGSQQLAFYANQARPSFILSTDEKLTQEQMQQFKAVWDDHSKGLNQGKTPILSAGMKPFPLNVSASDMQFVEQQKLSKENIALAFRVPLQILGLGGTPFGSAELLMQSWISTGLGFALNHIEQGFDRLFGLSGEPLEYTEFDTDALLRSAMKDRIDALVRATQGGVFSINDARALEGMPAVPYGDEPRVQQQLVPLSAAAAIPSAPPAPPAESQPAPGSDNQDDVDAGGDDQQRDYAALILQAAKRHERRQVA
jgi:HK97 family phage portal protein